MKIEVLKKVIIIIIAIMAILFNKTEIINNFFKTNQLERQIKEVQDYDKEELLLALKKNSNYNELTYNQYHKYYYNIKLFQKNKIEKEDVSKLLMEYILNLKSKIHIKV